MAQIVGETGRYEFNRIKLHPGKNIFCTSLYTADGGRADFTEVVTFLPPAVEQAEAKDEAPTEKKTEEETPVFLPPLTESVPSPVPSPRADSGAEEKTPEVKSAEKEKTPEPKNLFPVTGGMSIAQPEVFASVAPTPALVPETNKPSEPAPPTPAPETPHLFPVTGGMSVPKTEVPVDVPATATSSMNGNLLTVRRDKLTLGTIEAYNEKQNTFVPLKNIIRLLGLSYRRPEEGDTAEITVQDGSVVVLDFQKRDYLINNKHHSFYYYDFYKKGDVVYANIELLNRILPQTGLVVDLSDERIDVFPTTASLFGFFGTEPETPRSDLAPAPQASPVQPVVIDDLMGHSRVSGSPEAEDVLHLESSNKGGGEAPHPPADREKKGGEELLILQPRIKNMPPNDEFLEALDVEGQVYLPLKDALHLFEFPIKIDADQGTASGFFISSDNSFSLDLAKHEARVGDTHWDVTPQDIRKHEGQLYINSETFAKWFGIDTQVDHLNAMLHFTTDKTLPQEEREERQKRWTALLKEVNQAPQDYPVVQTPYQALGYPAVDVNLGSVYTHSPSSSSGETTKPWLSNYNIQGAGDIAYLTGNVYAQGATQGGALSVLRVQAGRKDLSPDLLGPLQATDFSFGDVTSPSLSLVTINSLGRGTTITNRDINASENFDFRNFTGDSVPGYEVELYRNDVLVAFQTVDASGRYNFTNIPILYGENIFRIVFYGQQGQREERVETVSAASSLLKENQFVYTFGAEQRGKYLLPFSSTSLQTPNSPAGLQAVSSVRYGVTRDVTMGAALAETNLIDGEHKYLDASTGANIFGVLTEGDFARDLVTNGWAASAAALGGFEGVSLHARYRKFDNFLSEAVNNNGTPLSSDQSLESNSQVFLPVLGSYNVGFSALREAFIDPSQVPRYTYSWRSSKSIGGISFTNSIDYVRDEQKRIQNSFGFQTRLFNADLRANGIMDVRPDQNLREIALMADYKLIDKLSAQSQVDKYLLTHQTNYVQNFNWDFDDFRLSFTGQLGDNGSYFGGLNFIFSLAHDPVANKWHMQPQQTSNAGSVSSRVYIDENNNNKLDPGESTYPDARIKVNNTLVLPDADDFFLAPVLPYQANPVKLEAASIADPLLTPVTQAYNVITRPGDNVVVDFPLVRTTIIDGTVVFIDDKGHKRDLSNIVVELQDNVGKPVHRVISAIDGYFSFDKIQVGEYWLTVPEEALNAFNAIIEKKILVKIDKIDEFMTGNEITLRQKLKLDAPPEMPTPVPGKDKP